MRISMVVFYCVLLTVSYSQTEYNGGKIWFEKKYHVNSLEELGLKKLQEEKLIFKRNKGIGMMLAGGGVLLTMAGISHTFNNGSFPEDEKDKNKIKQGDVMGIIGIGAFIGGLVMWGHNGERHSQIKNALKNIALNVVTIEMEGGRSKEKLNQITIAMKF